MIGNYIESTIGSYLGLNITQVLLLAFLITLVLMFIFKR